MKSPILTPFLILGAVTLISVLGFNRMRTTNSDLPQAHIRHNLVGYLPDETKVAIAFSNKKLKGDFSLLNQEGTIVYTGSLTRSSAPGWRFDHYYELDFSRFNQPGKYQLRIESTDDSSVFFEIGKDAYGSLAEDLLGFMRQQRCGYNPFLNIVCHKRDGRSFFGPMPDSTFVDVSGGWHDAGDQLKYLITGSNATARMMLAYELEPGKFQDQVNDLGQPGANGIPDVLDEAKWGLDWVHKMHSAPGLLFHQVADDRDHRGWKWPDRDSSDYGWGPNSYRAAYFATGEPQGLGKYQSESTGIANLAGRSAAAMAIGYRIWKERDPSFAQKCLKAAVDLYQMGKKQEGFMQGNSYGAPYRYNEDTWADDMEWGAAELFKVTGEDQYLEDARKYANLIGNHSWLVKDTASHYQLYPFVNVGHFALYDQVDTEFQKTLAGFYRDGIEHTLKRGKTNAFQIGIPFLWCSNNLATALITQILLYEKMTGDLQYHDFMLAQRDWLLGRNPWGTSMFMNIPANGEYPVDVHTSVWHLTRTEVPGGLVDGPIYTSIFNNLLGLYLNEPDEFAAFQNDHIVYHDNIGDYSTNEPTMDGTAGAVYFMAHFGQ